MGINFAAANMAGYNNPEIEIVPLMLDSGDAPTNPPTYETVDKILQRGVVPFLTITTPAGTIYYVVPLSYYNSSSGLITFSGCTQTVSGEQNSMNLVTVKFLRGVGSPIVKQVTFERSI